MPLPACLTPLTRGVYNEDREEKDAAMAAQCFCFVFSGVSPDEVLALRASIVLKQVVAKTAVLKNLDIGCIFEIVVQDPRLIQDIVKATEDRTGKRLEYQQYGGSA